MFPYVAAAHRCFALHTGEGPATFSSPRRRTLQRALVSLLWASLVRGCFAFGLWPWLPLGLELDACRRCLSRLRGTLLWVASIGAPIL